MKGEGSREKSKRQQVGTQGNNPEDYLRREPIIRCNSGDAKKPEGPGAAAD